MRQSRKSVTIVVGEDCKLSIMFLEIKAAQIVKERPKLEEVERLTYLQPRLDWLSVAVCECVVTEILS